MPRYIDTERLDEVVQDLNENHDTGITRYEYKRISAVLWEFPTANVVEVVRCKDCKHRDADDFCTGRGYPNLLVADDGFCDKGERSEDG